VTDYGRNDRDSIPSVTVAVSCEGSGAGAGAGLGVGEVTFIFATLQTVSGTPQLPFQWTAWASSQGVKLLDREADPPSTTTYYSSTTSYVLWSNYRFVGRAEYSRNFKRVLWKLIKQYGPKLSCT